uniref:Uncharacterized protein n=1 Tax=Physcomitrium patens TaxID=3218 RepID=A0A7I4BLU7_PHYPA
MHFRGVQGCMTGLAQEMAYRKTAIKITWIQVETLRSDPEKLSLSRNVICSKYIWNGSKTGASNRCAACQDLGTKVSIRQTGLNTLQQIQ